MHFAWADLCDCYKCSNSTVKFLVVGACVRARPLLLKKLNQNPKKNSKMSRRWVESNSDFTHPLSRTFPTDSVSNLEMIVLPLPGKFRPQKEKKFEKAYDTGSSQAVPHPSTIPARRCLTSVIGRERVFSSWYGRRHLYHGNS